ncbi:MAG: hypothetical protein JWM82_2150, partial [Myxococcales bacterium]|nr:hypothetical protein [Myxococcales bacterium]
GLAAAPAVPKLAEVAEARSFALATISITSLDHLLVNGATLGTSAVPLPIEPASVRDMMLGQAGLPPEVSANLDFGAPTGAAIVAGGKEPGVVVAVAARGTAEAVRAIAALGKQVDKRGDFVLVDNGSGERAWLLRDGAVIAFSDDLETLARGARLAMEARHAVAEDVTAVLFPDAIARANGTDVKTAIAMGIAQLKQAHASQPGAAPINDNAYQNVAEMMSLVGDAQTIELGMVVDSKKGLSLRARLLPRTASGLEKVVREARAYTFDTALLSVIKVPTAAGAWTLGSFMRMQMMHQRDHLQTSKLKGATAALAFVDAMLAGLGGDASYAFGVAKDAPLFSGAVEYSLKDATASAAVGGALDRLDKDAALALIEAQLGALPFFDWTVKREPAGKVKALHYALKLKKDLGLDPAVAKKIFGKGSSIDIYMGVAGTRLLATFGRDAKANLSRLAAPSAAVPGAALAATLAATKGRDQFYHFDFAQLLSLATTFAPNKDKRAEAIAKANAGPIPIYGSAGGDVAGRAWSFDLTFPVEAFKAAGAVVKSGMNGGGGASDEASPPHKKSGKKK